MNLRVIFVFLLLVMLTTEAHAWWRRRRRRSSVTTVTPPYSSGSGSSPAGGPSGNPNAVVCHHNRRTNELNCKKDTQSVKCTTQPPTERRDSQPKGPTPLGEYLIGRRYTHRKHNIDWYKLYPKKEDSSGYYGYREKTEKGRYVMGLHPGMTSWGCVTVKAPDYDKDACWQRIRNVIDSGSMWYWHLWPYHFSGFLYVHD